nr:site-specific integrase [Pelistega sp. MC2]
MKRTKSKVLPTIICIAVETAMRRSEIINIRREHINFEDGTLFIPDSKNGDSRTIPLSPIAKYTLINYLSKNNSKNKLFNISTSAVSKSFHRALLLAREDYIKTCEKYHQEENKVILTDLRFHDLRHEATSRLASVYSMHELARITGHKDTRMLLRYYHPDVIQLGQKLAQSQLGQLQFNVINQMLLQLL